MSTYNQPVLPAFNAGVSAPDTSSAGRWGSAEDLFRTVLSAAARAGLGWVVGKGIESITGFKLAPLIGAGLGVFWPTVAPKWRQYVSPYVTLATDWLVRLLAAPFERQRGPIPQEIGLPDRVRMWPGAEYS